MGMGMCPETLKPWYVSGAINKMFYILSLVYLFRGYTTYIYRNFMVGSTNKLFI